MWIKLLTQQVIDVNGTPTRCYAGDWVNVGKQTALLWVSQKLAEKPGKNLTADEIDYTSGIAVIGNMDVNTKQQISEGFPHLEIGFIDSPEILFSETLIYDTKVKLKTELMHVGFKHLETWQILCPLFDYKTLASNVVKDDEKDKLLDIIKELRVPLYEPRLMFVRRCDETQELIKRYLEYQNDFSDYRLAFLAALYQVKSLILALPDSWYK